uniref:Uncharacterized protein n=1 Tax=Anopheles albimanus TaxID=7167 RepID=A0A182F5L9_ANOAL
MMVDSVPRDTNTVSHFLALAFSCGIFRSNRSAPGCVALTEEGSWKVLNCNRHLPYVCELHTSGPALHEPKLRRRCSIKRPNNRDAPPSAFPSNKTEESLDQLLVSKLIASIAQHD